MVHADRRPRRVMANLKKVQSGESIDEWMDRIPQPQQASLRWLRSLLHGVEGLHETVKWAHPCYAYNGLDLFSLTWSKGHVNLQLWKGVHLENPFGVVEGTGKEARHIKVKNSLPRPEEAVITAIGSTMAMADSGEI